MPCFPVENSLLAESQRLNVAEPVEDGKSIAVQENPLSVVGKRRLGANIEVVVHFDNIGAGCTGSPLFQVIAPYAANVVGDPVDPETLGVSVA